MSLTAVTLAHNSYTDCPKTSANLAILQQNLNYILDVCPRLYDRRQNFQFCALENFRSHGNMGRFDTDWLTHSENLR